VMFCAWPVAATGVAAAWATEAIESPIANVPRQHADDASHQCNLLNGLCVL
jgi:hypothetical protein